MLALPGVPTISYFTTMTKSNHSTFSASSSKYNLPALQSSVKAMKCEMKKIFTAPVFQFSSNQYNQ